MQNFEKPADETRTVLPINRTVFPINRTVSSVFNFAKTARFQRETVGFSEKPSGFLGFRRQLQKNEFSMKIVLKIAKKSKKIREKFGMTFAIFWTLSTRE